MHGYCSRNYVVKKTDNQAEIIDILLGLDRAGDGLAQLMLGFINEEGIIVHKNATEGKRFYRRSAKTGDKRGQYFTYFLDKTNIPLLYESSL